MSSYEYHQILQFLYFEGYADSYENAEYLFEQLSDEEFEDLCERAHSFPLNKRERESVENIGRMNRGDYSNVPDEDPTPTRTKSASKRKRKTDLSKVIIAQYLYDEGYVETPESGSTMAESISEQWAEEILDEAHLIIEKPYQIYGPDPHGSSDSESRPLGKPYRNKKRAKTRADRLDDEIGGYRHSVRKVDEEYKDLTPEKEEKVKNRVGELARDIQVQGERMKDLNKKPFGKYRPKVKQEKGAILKSARKKQKLVQNASDALIRTSTSRSASIQKRIQDLKDRS